MRLPLWILTVLWLAPFALTPCAFADPAAKPAEKKTEDLGTQGRDGKTKKGRKRKLTPPPYYAAIGEGQTLPEGVLRVRLPFTHVTGNSGYDEHGKKQDLGASLNVTGTAFVLEYGATSRLALQLLAPYVMSSEVHLDGQKFARSGLYASNYGAFVGGVATKLQAQGICPDVESCTKLINDGYALPADTAVTLPSGERLTVKAGVPVKDYANALVVGAARPEPGRTGLGDVEVGALYMVYQRIDADFAVGGGLRLPTGSFADVPSSQLATGRGTLDFGLRLNADYSPARGLWLGWQNQSEIMLMKGKKSRTSLLDNSELNTADATSSEARAAGADGRANNEKFERRGIRNVGFFKLGWGLGDVDQALAAIGTLAEYKYNLESREYLDGVDQGPPQTSMAALGGVVLDGLAYRFPMQVEYDYQVPLAGTNVTVAQTVQLLTLKGYYKF